MPVNPQDRNLSDEELIALFTDPPAIPERTAIALMYDENSDHGSIAPLRGELKLYVTTVQEQGLAGEKSDFRLLAHARRIGCTMVVRDLGYRHLHSRLAFLELSHAGIVFVPYSRTPEDVFAFFEAMAELSTEKDAPNILHFQYWVV